MYIFKLWIHIKKHMPRLADCCVLVPSSIPITFTTQLVVVNFETSPLTFKKCATWLLTGQIGRNRTYEPYMQVNPKYLFAFLSDSLIILNRYGYRQTAPTLNNFRSGTESVFVGGTLTGSRIFLHLLELSVNAANYSRQKSLTSSVDLPQARQPKGGH